MAEWIGRMQNQAVIVSVFLVVGVILSGGCGQNGSVEAGEQTGQEIEDVPGRDGNELNVPESVAAAGQQEENSLEEWQILHSPDPLCHIPYPPTSRSVSAPCTSPATPRYAS